MKVFFEADTGDRMEKISIYRLGPVKSCDFELKEFSVLVGEQGTGKSTIAKTVFFFKNVKKLLVNDIKKRKLLVDYAADNESSMSLKNRLIKEIRKNFLQTFGSTWSMDREMHISCIYSENYKVGVSLVDDTNNPNYIWIEISDKLIEALNDFQNGELRMIQRLPEDVYESILKNKVNNLFRDDDEVVYIPAGRSILTLLSSQLQNMYSMMDVNQRNDMDYCTQNYLERILKMKSGFSSPVFDLIRDKAAVSDVSRKDQRKLEQLAEQMTDILHGSYQYVNGEEHLNIRGEKYVKINYASSGQQEVVWILNVLFNFVLNQVKALFIIEEPESHLYPNTQKLVMEFISRCMKNGSRVLITTHSPYVLGSINNMLYAHKVSMKKPEKIQELRAIIDDATWIDYQNLSAWIMKDGKIEDCCEDELEAIKNEVIDGASEEINGEFEKMVALLWGDDEC